MNHLNLNIGKIPTKLKRIYKLNFPNNDIDEKNRINKVLDSKDTFLYLRNNTFRPRITRGLGKEGNNFLRLINLQRNIPMYKLTPPDDIKKLVRWLDKCALL